MTTLLNGLLGGLLVGIVATIAVEILGGRRSPIAAMLDVVFDGGGGPARSRRVATSILYGTVGGLVLVALELYVLGVVGIPPGPLEAYGLAVAWGGVLLAVLAAVYRFGFRLQFDRDVLVALVLFHAVYGLGLGIWIRTTWIT